MKVGDTITLTGKSRHGKNRVKEQGDQWKVKKLQDKVFCKNNGNGAMLVSLTPKGLIRWIGLPIDEDFDWT